MKSIDSITKNKGLGLLEVLISTVVIALGLLALASMQGNFLSGSGDNKTRAEAQSLAQQKIEQLRNMIIRGNYTGISTQTDPLNPIAGSNATFSRNWTVTNLTAPARKKIDMTVSWGNSANQRITLTSEITFINPASSVALANYGEQGQGSFGQSPSPGQNASEMVTNKTVQVFDSNGNLNSGLTAVNINGYTFYQDNQGNLFRYNIAAGIGVQIYMCSALSPFDVDLSNPQNYDSSTGALLSSPVVYLYARRLNLDGQPGNEAIDLFTMNYAVSGSGNNISYIYDGSCTLQHRYFGGIILPIKGTVHTVFNLDDIQIDHNKEDMYCAYNGGSGQTQRPYACYVGGNCAVSPAGNESDLTTCPNPDAADATVGPGGWSGLVGLINVKDTGAGKESVCFEDDLNGTSTNYSTARKYKTLNNGLEQGINEAFNCQDFLVVGRQANLSKLSAECSAEAGTLNLPPTQIVRTINGPNVVVTAVNNNYCTSRTLTTYTLDVTVNGGTADSVKTLTGTSCTGNGSDYSCSESTYGQTSQIYAQNSTQSGTCTITPLSTSQTNACTISLSATPSYTLNGYFSGSGNVAKMIVEDSFNNTGTCTSSSTDFSCTIPTSDTTITIETLKNSGTVIDYCTKVVSPGGGDSSSNTYSSVCTLVKK